MTVFTFPLLSSDARSQKQTSPEVLGSFVERLSTMQCDMIATSFTRAP